MRAIKPQSSDPTFVSQAGDLANTVTSEKSRGLSSTLSKSIDSVLDTTASTTSETDVPIRALATSHPSWIGPPRIERPLTPGLLVMKQQVHIDFSSPGLKPPVYIFTSLSTPEWEEVEMQLHKQAGGGYRFSKTFEAEEGEYQYKFRLGPGDWWVCDDSKPTVNDGDGNKNNLLVVMDPESTGHRSAPMQQTSAVPRRVPVPTTMLASKTVTATASAATTAVKLPNSYDEQEDVEHFDTGEYISMESETGSRPRNISDDEAVAGSVDLSHEKVTSQQDNADDHTSSDSSEGTPATGKSPGLPHEECTSSTSPISRPGQSYSNPHSTSPLLRPMIPEEADPNDPTLEPFPTDRAGILALLHQIAVRGEGAPFAVQSGHSATASVSSLPSLREVDEEEDDADDNF